MKQIDYLDRIVVDSNIMVGKPVIKGTRIPVELILEQLSYNLDPKEIFAAYPRLTKEDIKACLVFAGKTLKNKTLVGKTVTQNLSAANPA